MSLSPRYRRPRAYDDALYQWHLGRVPQKTFLDSQKVENPARHSAIFVVHGMGTQQWTDTAALLRSGFEDALEEIHKKHQGIKRSVEDTPAPFIAEGFWANYDDFEQTFPDDAGSFRGRMIEFFSSLWKKRTLSASRTLRWFLWEQLKLMHPRTWSAWFVYIPLQIISPVILFVLFVLMPRTLARVLGDVRLYIDPRGIIERAIVQRIDKRVGESFLRLLGLDWDFNPLRDKEKMRRNGKPIEFNRIIWVAHSLGSVISFNVLSDLFYRVQDLEKKKDLSADQREGILKFRQGLRRFITIGSPLDKIAFLFGEGVLRPWPARPRGDLLLDAGEDVPNGDGTTRREWWINFYHVWDPVSGFLSHPLVCGTTLPVNYHIGFWRVPGLAHVAYWKDSSALQFILSRAYGSRFLPVPPTKPPRVLVQLLFAFVFHVALAAVILALLIALAYGFGFLGD